MTQTTEVRPIAHLNVVPPVELESESDTDRARYRLETTLGWIAGLGHVLRSVEVNFKDDPNDISARAVGFVEGVRAVGDLLTVLTDSAYGELSNFAGDHRA